MKGWSMSKNSRIVFIIFCYVLFYVLSDGHAEEGKLKKEYEEYVKDFFENRIGYQLQEIKIMEEKNEKGDFLISEIPSIEHIPLLVDDRYYVWLDKECKGIYYFVITNFLDYMENVSNNEKNKNNLFSKVRAVEKIEKLLKFPLIENQYKISKEYTIIPLDRIRAYEFFFNIYLNDIICRYRNGLRIWISMENGEIIRYINIPPPLPKNNLELQKKLNGLQVIEIAKKWCENEPYFFGYSTKVNEKITPQLVVAPFINFFEKKDWKNPFIKNTDFYYLWEIPFIWENYKVNHGVIWVDAETKQVIGAGPYELNE